MGLREQITEAARTVPIRLGPNAIANAQNGHTIRLSGNEAEAVADAVMGLVEARVRELEAERELLQRKLDAVEGKRPGIWDSWAEHIARKEATPPEPPPKPHLTLEQAREQAAEYASRTLNGDQ